MRRLFIWSIEVACIWVGAIVIFGALAQAQSGGIASRVLGILYAPALAVAVWLSDTAGPPGSLLIIAALLAQTFLMALGIGALREWRRRRGGREAATH